MKLFRTKKEVEPIYKITEKPKHLYFAWHGKDHFFATIKVFDSKEDAENYYESSIWGSDIEYIYLGLTSEAWNALSLNIELPDAKCSISSSTINRVIEEI